MHNSKGFTLIELLVAITIIGIITVLALPGVSQLQARNRDKKFESYADRLMDAGKLYVDAYADDLFGTVGDGCADISYLELSSKSLIKKYETDGISCDNENTFVQVNRKSGKYSYEVSLLCTKGDKKVYDKVIPKCDQESLSDVPTIAVSYKNIGGTDNWSSSKEVTIKVTAKNGLNQGASISYGWSKDRNVFPTSMKTYNFRNNQGETSLTYKFTENDVSGQNYLFIDGDYVIDVGGLFAEDVWTEEKLKFDKIPPVKPVLTNNQNGIWTGADFVNAGKYTIVVESNDPEYNAADLNNSDGSGIHDYQYRYPNSENIWHTYSNSNTNRFTTTPFTANRNEIVEIRACDYSGNCSEPASSNIMIDKIKPEITINGDLRKIYGPVFDLYEGVTFTDNITSSDDIIKKVYLNDKEISNSSELSIGESVVTYKGIDIAGNEATVTRKITLVVASTEFDYKEEEQVYTVEATGTYVIEAYGAQGGNSGGNGGYLKAEVYLTAGEKLYITTGGVNGFNGGGGYGNSKYYPGGGATTIKYDGKVIVIAGGGGAAGATGEGGAGGASDGSGGASVGSGSGIDGTNGGGGSNSPDSTKVCGCDRYERVCVGHAPTYKCCCRGIVMHGSWTCLVYGCTCGGGCTGYSEKCVKEKKCPVSGKSGKGGASSVVSPATKVTQENGNRDGNGYVKVSYKI